MSHRHFLIAMKTFSVAFTVIAIVMAYFSNFLFIPGNTLTVFEIVEFWIVFFSLIAAILLTTLAWGVDCE